MNKKVGRPSKISKEYFKQLKMLYPEIKTRRGILNKHYQLISFEVLTKMEDVKFLIDSDNDIFKQSILIELGRLENESDIKTVARYICDRAKIEKKTVHQWVDTIRLIRKASKELI